jgi:hypothetical protein
VRDCFVFYEDQEVPGLVANFGPHRLLCACVEDLVGIDARELQKDLIACKPCRGVTKQVTALIIGAPQLLKSNKAVFAVFDSDKVHEQLHIGPDDDPVKAMHDRGVPPEVRILLLNQNTESLLQAVLGCEGAGPVELPKKKPAKRDAILNRAADGARTLRDCVIGKVPSFKTIVDGIVAALGE